MLCPRKECPRCSISSSERDASNRWWTRWTPTSRSSAAFLKARLSALLFALMLGAALAPTWRGGVGYWRLHRQIFDAATGALNWPSIHLVFAFPELPAFPSVVFALSFGAFAVEKLLTTYAWLYRNGLHAAGRQRATAIAATQHATFLAAVAAKGIGPTCRGRGETPGFPDVLPFRNCPDLSFAYSLFSDPTQHLSTLVKPFPPPSTFVNRVYYLSGLFLYVLSVTGCGE